MANNNKKPLLFKDATDALEQIDLAGLLHHRLWMNGAWHDGYDDFVVTDPATDISVANVASCDESLAELALDAAHEAFISWQGVSSKVRCDVLRRWFDLIIENQEYLAGLITIENGKPFKEAIGEVIYAASFVEWYAEQAKRIQGEVLSPMIAGQKTFLFKQAIGVCVAITPWNFPAAMITRKVAPALAAGCTVVLKPAPQTPLTSLALAELAQRAGIPAGVLNVIPTSQEQTEVVGRVLCEDQRVRHISFTGSTVVGKTLMALASHGVKKVALELGGHAPCIVFADADLDTAVSVAINSKFRNAGQTCISSNRLYVHESIAFEFTQRLKSRVEQLVVGNGFEPQSFLGPVINDQAVLKIMGQIDQAKSQGAKLICGGTLLDHHESQRFIAPTILTQVKPTMRVMHEETFGPVLPIATFQEEAEVIALANQTPYGLAAYFCAQNMTQIWRVAEQLQFGMIGINTAALSTEATPFGGIKESGLGREGSHLGIEEYLSLKYVAMQ